MSQLKVCGSERNTKSGARLSTKYLRLKWFLLNPSIFQDRTVKCIASLMSDLSGEISLN